eukprot:12669870-Alexandrium_andersonii.AAC.1
MQCFLEPWGFIRCPVWGSSETPAKLSGYSREAQKVFTKNDFKVNGGSFRMHHRHTWGSKKE